MEGTVTEPRARAKRNAGKTMPDAARDARPGQNLKERNMGKQESRTLPQRLYIGPSKPFGLPLMQGAILRGEPARVFPQLAGHLEAHPDMARLFVTVAELPEARRQVKENGSVLHRAYEHVKKASDELRAGQGR